MRNRPTSHLLIQAVMLLSTVMAYLAIIDGARLRGYWPSLWVAARDWLALGLMMVGFVILVGTLRYRGNLLIYTIAVVLFSLGLMAQYRLFSDPEYTSRGQERSVARLAKAQAIRARAIGEGYDQQKLEVLFDGEPPPPRAIQPNASNPSPIDLADVLRSVRTYTPLLSLLGLVFGFTLIRREGALLWVQRHSILIAAGTLAPLMVIIILFTRGGKFIGGMTPWEPAKVLFLLSLTGVLVDSYHVLGKTRWGLPPLRFVLPLVITTIFALVPFFLLGDFGQLMVFGIVYTLLYLVAVRRPGQVLPGLGLLLAVFLVFSAVEGIPRRVQFRYHLWEHTWRPPPEAARWWAPWLKELRASYGDAGARVTNEEAWFDLGSQVVQAIFGVHHGQLLGTGLGLGLPETVPVADSDFIYAAIAEELGFVGGGCILLLLLILGAAGGREATRSPDMYTKLLAAGVTAFLVCQALINISGVLKLTPMTGITLPFVSHGGWSLVTSFTMVGILMGISHRNAVQSA